MPVYSLASSKRASPLSMVSPDILHLPLPLQRSNLKHWDIHFMCNHAVTVRPAIQQSTPARSSSKPIFFWHFLQEDLSLFAFSTFTLFTMNFDVPKKSNSSKNVPSGSNAQKSWAQKWQPHEYKMALSHTIRVFCENSPLVHVNMATRIITYLVENAYSICHGYWEGDTPKPYPQKVGKLCCYVRCPEGNATRSIVCGKKTCEKLTKLINGGPLRGSTNEILEKSSKKNVAQVDALPSVLNCWSKTFLLKKDAPNKS